MATLLSSGSLSGRHSHSLLTRNAQRFTEALADTLQQNWNNLTEFDGLPVTFYRDFATVELGHGVTVHVDRVSDPAFPTNR